MAISAIDDLGEKKLAKTIMIIPKFHTLCKLTQEKRLCIAGAVFTVNRYRTVSRRGYKYDVRVNSNGIALQPAMGKLFTDCHRGTDNVIYADSVYIHVCPR